ncbi:MAG TPA: hypothetical protein VFH73_25645 [Polyangia bacterium]|nr:hypothetical protein [Polyangia bacterium]
MRNRHTLNMNAAWLLLLSGAVAACSSGKSASSRAGGSGGAGGAGTGGAGGVAQFEPLPPAVYGAKVKNTLVGQPVTSEELAALTANPGALSGLIDGWIALPAWRARMFGFFQQAFQQTQAVTADYDDQLGLNTNNWAVVDQTRFARAAEESFARTVLQLIDEGRPFNEVVTTQRLMLNPPLLMAMAFMDAAPQDDAGNPVPAAWWPLRKFPGFQFVRVDTPIPVSESADPASPNYMHWTDPTPYNGANAAMCATPDTKNGFRGLIALATFFFGGRVGCGKTVSQFSDQDWDDWKMVTVRAPRGAGEERTLFWDLPALRAATELVVATPRVGFMTTPAFFANWPTNASNQARVTANQALIVGLGLSFDDRGTTVQVSESSSDAMHVQPGTACYGCHQTLDPMRDFFRQSYNYVYAQQLNAAADGIPAVAQFTVANGAPVSGNGIAALAQAMATHDRFAVAWTQKLCRLANSASCAEDDPEFLRVAAVFRDSGYNFKALVRALFSSPLITFASRTKTADEGGIVIGISRREALCASLEGRLGIADPCGIRGIYGKRTPADRAKATAANLAGAVPGDGYARGSEVPLLPHDPNLFFVSATDNLCGMLAPTLIDAGAGSRWSSAGAGKEAAIKDFVGVVMGVAAQDGRTKDLTAILTDHYMESVAAGETPSDALRSTFVLACSSPLTISSGL